MFVPSLLLVCVGLVLALRYVQETNAPYGYSPVDYVGLAAWTGVVLALVFGLIQLQVSRLSNIVVWSSLSVAGIGAGLLIFWAMVSPGRLMRNAPFPLFALAIIILTGMTLNFATLGYAIHLFNFMRIVQQFHPVVASVALAPLAIRLVAGGVLAGRRRGKQPHVQMIVSGLALMLIAILLTAVAVLLWRVQVAYLLLAALMVLFGAGFALASAAWQALYLGSMPLALAGLSSAISSAAGQIGGVIASTVLAALIVSFGTNNFATRLDTMGLTPERVIEATAALDRALQPEALSDPSTELGLLNTALVAFYQESFAVAFGGVLLVSALIIVLCATLVWFGLGPRLRQKLARPGAQPG